MKYAWEVPYVHGLVQTDEEAMHTALYEAIAATGTKTPKSGQRHRRHCPRGCGSWNANADCGDNRKVRMKVRQDVQERSGEHPYVHRENY